MSKEELKAFIKRCEFNVKYHQGEVIRHRTDLVFAERTLEQAKDELAELEQREAVEIMEAELKVAGGVA